MLYNIIIKLLKKPTKIVSHNQYLRTVALRNPRYFPNFRGICKNGLLIASVMARVSLRLWLVLPVPKVRRWPAGLVWFMSQSTQFYGLNRSYGFLRCFLDKYPAFITKVNQSPLWVCNALFWRQTVYLYSSNHGRPGVAAAINHITTWKSSQKKSRNELCCFSLKFVFRDAI